LLAPTILVFSIINPMVWLIQSIGLQQRSLNIALVLAPVMICSYLVGLPYGPSGVALAFSATMVLLLLPLVYWSLHGTVISVRELLSTAGQALLAGAVAGVAAAIMQYFTAPIPSAVLRLALGGTVMLAVYVFTLLFVMKQSVYYFDLLRGLRHASALEDR
jgi:PST family polysaccharide transporter